MNQVKPKLRAVSSGEFKQYWKTRMLLHCALNLDIAETVAAATTRACAKKKAMHVPTNHL